MGFFNSFYCILILYEVFIELSKVFSLDWRWREKAMVTNLHRRSSFQPRIVPACDPFLPPASSCKMGSCRQVLVPEVGIVCIKTAGKCFCSSCLQRHDIYVSLQVLKSLKVWLLSHCSTIQKKRRKKILYCPWGLCILKFSEVHFGFCGVYILLIV